MRVHRLRKLLGLEKKDSKIEERPTQAGSQPVFRGLVEVMPEVSQEREEEIMNKIADDVCKRGLETAAIFIFDVIQPMRDIYMDLGSFYATPFLSFFGFNSDEYLAVLKKEGNIERLKKRIDEYKVKYSKKD